MDASGALKQEKRVVENVLAATENAMGLAESLARRASDTAETRSMIHDLASQSLALKRVVRSLPRFDAAAKRSQRRSLNMKLPESLQRRFNQELEDTKRNEHEALRELHAISVVLHDISGGPIEPSEVTAAMHRIYAELMRLKSVLKAIHTDVLVEAGLIEKN